MPFVDHELVERMAGVAFDYRMADGVIKAPLKRVFESLVPEGIRERKKIGFPVPLEEIFFGRQSDQGGPGRDALDRWLRFNLENLTGGSITVADLGVQAGAVAN